MRQTLRLVSYARSYTHGAQLIADIGLTRDLMGRMERFICNRDGMGGVAAGVSQSPLAADATIHAGAAQPRAVSVHVEPQEQNGYGAAMTHLLARALTRDLLVR